MGISVWRGAAETRHLNGPRDPMHSRSEVRFNLPAQVNGAAQQSAPARRVFRCPSRGVAIRIERSMRSPNESSNLRVVSSVSRLSDPDPAESFG
jgi:hypothetical protein